MSQPTPSKSDRIRELTESRGEADSDPESDPDAETTPEDLRTLFLDSDDAGELISSLSSETARSIVVSLHEDPATASELADSVDTTVQNVRHHLDSLQEAGLVEVTDTRYSTKGREMDVYAPVERPMVVFVGREDRSGFVDSLKRFLGAIGVLAAASLVIQEFLITGMTASGGAIPRNPESVGAGGGAAPVGMPPGLLFFAGGALILALASAWQIYRRNAGDASA